MSSSIAIWGKAKRPRASSFETLKFPLFRVPKRPASENSYLSEKNDCIAPIYKNEVMKTENFGLAAYQKILFGNHIDFASDTTQVLAKETRFKEAAEVLGKQLDKVSILPTQEKEILEKSAKTIEDIKNGPLLALRKAEIPDEEIDRLRKCFTSSDSDHTIVINKFSVEMTRSKISCLRPSVWLNDEAINFYMLMLMDRDEKLTAAAGGESVRRTSHYFNSFFIAKMLENDKYTYSNVKRWSKKFDVFQKDKIFMPINIRNTHWTMAVVFVQKKEIHYYDSMSGSGSWYLNSILKWLEDEAREKKNVTLDKTEWKLIDREPNVPQQRNGVDCGVFSTVCADYLSDDLPLSYSQADMPDFRTKIGCAILRGFITY